MINLICADWLLHYDVASRVRLGHVWRHLDLPVVIPGSVPSRTAQRRRGLRMSECASLTRRTMSTLMRMRRRVLPPSLRDWAKAMSSELVCVEKVHGGAFAVH